MKTESLSTDFSRARAMYPPEVRKVVHYFRQKTRNDVVRDDWWSQSYSTSDTYSRYLGAVLVPTPIINPTNDVLERDMEEIQIVNRLVDENPVRKLIESRKQTRDFHLLDLMSYGTLHRELGVTGCAVALSDRRREGEAAEDAAAQRELILGDVISGRPWVKLEKYVAEKTNGKGFGVILCNPMAGLENIPSHASVYRYIFNHVYRVLSSQNGVFATTFHNSSYYSVARLTEQLNTIAGLEAYCYPPSRLSITAVFMLRRTPEAPERLPILEAA